VNRPQTISGGGLGAGAEATQARRIPACHPVGYLEGCGNIYADLAGVISARLEGRDPHPMATHFPTVVDGAKGVKFITAAVESSNNGGVWTDATLDL